MARQEAALFRFILAVASVVAVGEAKRSLIPPSCINIGQACMLFFTTAQKK